MEQFSIRDVLLLVAIVALALGWWFDRAPKTGRFQLHADGGQVLILDTATGQLWESSSATLFQNQPMKAPKITADK
jgi:hypothetical protein